MVAHGGSDAVRGAEGGLSVGAGEVHAGLFKTGQKQGEQKCAQGG